MSKRDWMKLIEKFEIAPNTVNSIVAFWTNQSFQAVQFAFAGPHRRAWSLYKLLAVRLEKGLIIGQ